MGVKPIGNNYHGFIFAGENSRTYGVYITEPAVFDAPERDVDMLTIPGRNGELVKDNGRFRNINVTYHCALPAESDTDFNAGIADFRNMLASKIGYQELSDEINTGEFRQGAFIDGIAVETVNPEAGTFDVVFNCKPQRFLTTGQTAVAVTSGDSITNPTLFDSRPMLQIWGYGGMDINGDEMEIISTNIGDISIWGGVANYFNSNRPSGGAIGGGPTIPTGVINSLNVGDSITVGASTTIAYLKYKRASTNLVSFMATPPTGGMADVSTTSDGVLPMATRTSTVFHKGTTGTESLTASFTIDTEANGVSYTDTATANLALSYDGDRTITIGYTWTWTTNNIMTGMMQVRGDLPSLSAYSTASALGSPIYFDLDIGEAYKIENDVPVSVNNAVTIPVILPTLSPGANTITFDNTITQFKIVPRWWTV